MKKISNKVLIGLLVALVAVYFATKLLVGNRSSNIPEEIVKVDTTAITEIRISSKATQFKQLMLVKEGKHWSVRQDNQTEQTDAALISSMLDLFPFKPKQLISKNKDKWNEFQVGDSSTHVTFFAGEKTNADFRVGGIGFLPTQGQQIGAGNVFTYVRNEDGNEVYSVQGFIGGTFDRSFNDWRDKSIIKVRPTDIDKIEVVYPLDSGFVLQKADSKWVLNTALADSSKVAQFISMLEDCKASSFAENFTESGDALYTIRIKSGLNDLAVIRAWDQENGRIVHSSLRADSYFKTQGLEFLFKTKKEFLP